MADLKTAETLRAFELTIARLGKIVTAWEHRLSRIEANRRYYMATKMPIRKKYLDQLKKADRLVTALENVLGKNRITVTRTSKGGIDRVLFMCTHNQAAKLRDFADKDLRVNNKGRTNNGTNSPAADDGAIHQGSDKREALDAIGKEHLGHPGS